MSELLRYSITIGNTQHVNKTEAELLAVDGISQAMIDELKAKASIELVNKQAFTHIDNVYPAWKQINIIRVGTADEQAQMNTFIDAVRAWANSELPQLAELELITL